MKEQVAKLILAARKMRGLTQTDVAQYLGITQATYSRYESGQLEVSVYDWLKLTELFGIKMDAVKYGFIDQGIPAGVSSAPKENGVWVPKNYVKNRCIKIREILPLISFVNEVFGPTSFLAMVRDLEFDELFFMNLDNQVNFNFLVDLLVFINSQNVVTKLMIEKMAAKVIDYSAHGILAERYLMIKDSLSLIYEYLRNRNHYEDLYRYKILKQNKSRLIVQVEPSEVCSLEMDGQSPEVLSFWHTYVLEKIKCMGNFENRFPKQVISLVEQESIFTSSGDGHRSLLEICSA